MKYSEVGDALHFCHFGHHLGRELFQHLKVWSDNLDRIGALDARQGLFDVVLDVLREIEADARQLVAEFLLQLFGQRLLGEVGRPFVERL